MIFSSCFKHFSRTDLHNSKQQKDQNTQILTFTNTLNVFLENQEMFALLCVQIFVYVLQNSFAMFFA